MQLEAGLAVLGARCAYSPLQQIRVQIKEATESLLRAAKSSTSDQGWSSRPHTVKEKDRRKTSLPPWPRRARQQQQQKANDGEPTSFDSASGSCLNPFRETLYGKVGFSGGDLFKFVFCFIATQIVLDHYRIPCSGCCCLTLEAIQWSVAS